MGSWEHGLLNPVLVGAAEEFDCGCQLYDVADASGVQAGEGVDPLEAVADGVGVQSQNAGGPDHVQVAVEVGGEGVDQRAATTLLFGGEGVGEPLTEPVRGRVGAAGQIFDHAQLVKDYHAPGAAGVAQREQRRLARVRHLRDPAAGAADARGDRARLRPGHGRRRRTD